MPESVAVVSVGGKEFTSTGHEGKEALISAGALKGNRISKNKLDWTLFTKWGFMMQLQLVFVCVRGGRERERVFEAPFLKIIPCWRACLSSLLKCGEH